MWKPIETAPKDGTSVLLLVTRYCVMSGHNDLGLIGATAPRDEWWHTAPDGIAYPLEGAPTHWTPFPALIENQK